MSCCRCVFVDLSHPAEVSQTSLKNTLSTRNPFNCFLCAFYSSTHRLWRVKGRQKLPGGAADFLSELSMWLWDVCNRVLRRCVLLLIQNTCGGSSWTSRQPSLLEMLVDALRSGLTRSCCFSPKSRCNVSEDLVACELFWNKANITTLILFSESASGETITNY